MKTAIVRPRASALAESLRDIGYSFETAVSDIIDNSIAADATAIDIWCLGDGDPLQLAIIDNGTGMGETRLIDAMRPGSADPRDQRSESDLGRFGLGMKTASFSQARRLTVASRQRDGEISAACWDLDRVSEENEWVLELPEGEGLARTPWLDRLPGTGTLVLWEKLDRFAESLDGEGRADLVNAKLAALSRHLSLVFHRFLSGGGRRKRKLAMRINNRPITAFDPFFLDHPATQTTPMERVRIGKSDIEIQAHILPHHSKLSPETRDFYQSRGDFLSNQGAYVYRNDRLMAWGNWFGMKAKGEATKLARVRIDFTSELDDQWTIDIKKSRAHPPPEVRRRFRQIIDRITDRSVKVYTGRATRALADDKLPLWRRIPTHGGMAYVPDRKHPLVESLHKRLDADGQRHLECLLEGMSSALPVDAIYVDLATAPGGHVAAAETMTEDECRARLLELRHLVDPGGKMGAAIFRKVALSTGLFSNCESLAESIITEICS
ncbi:ATP-binding protein [Hyphomonas sp.]|uniref:ATP-binding protein n=1 Tax=Hyphomonas sp. TaxID=87 RepID=UPI003919285B